MNKITSADRGNPSHQVALEHTSVKSVETYRLVGVTALLTNSGKKQRHLRPTGKYPQLTHG